MIMWQKFVVIIFFQILVYILMAKNWNIKQCLKVYHILQIRTWIWFYIKSKRSFLYFVEFIMRNFNGFSRYKLFFLPHYINTDICKVSLSLFVHFQNFLIVFVISFFTFVSLNVDLGQTFRLFRDTK